MPASELDRIQKIEIIIADIYLWFEKQGYQGIDIYDLYDNKLFHTLIMQENLLVRKSVRKIITYFIKFFPSQVQKLNRNKPNYNNKSLSLIIQGLLNLYSIYHDEAYLDKAEKLAAILLNNGNTQYSGIGWGYPFNWSSTVYVPKGTPSSVVTCFVGNCLFNLYQITKQEAYLTACDQACLFLLNGLNSKQLDENKMCLSYTPVDTNYVINANLFIVEFFIRYGLSTNKIEYLISGEKILNYILEQQKEDGSFNYHTTLSTKNSKFRSYSNDHYHTGFELRCLYNIESLLNAGLKPVIYNYYEYYISNYISNDSIYTFHHKKYPINIHSFAEFIILNTVINDFNLLDRKKFWEIFDNVLSVLYDEKDRLFNFEVFSILKFKFKMSYKFFRWSQAWMFYALTYLLSAERVKGANDINK